MAIKEKPAIEEETQNKQLVKEIENFISGDDEIYEGYKEVYEIASNHFANNEKDRIFAIGALGVINEEVTEGGKHLSPVAKRIFLAALKYAVEYDEEGNAYFNLKKFREVLLSETSEFNIMVEYDKNKKVAEITEVDKAYLDNAYIFEYGLKKLKEKYGTLEGLDGSIYQIGETAIKEWLKKNIPNVDADSAVEWDLYKTNHE